MKTRKVFVITLIVLVCTCVARSEENYWKVIRGYIEQSNDANAADAEVIGQKAQAYLESLTTEQLILAGRECSREMEATLKLNQWCEGGIALAFFFSEYPKRDSLKDLEPIFMEIAAKEQSSFWRMHLVEFLGSSRRSSLLSEDQLCEVAEKIGLILGDEEEHFWIRFEACMTIRHILSTLDERNLLAEEAIKRKIEEGVTLRRLINEVRQGKILLSKRYSIAHGKTLSYYNSYGQILLDVLQQRKVNPILQREAIGSLRSVLLVLTGSFSTEGD